MSLADSIVDMWQLNDAAIGLAKKNMRRSASFRCNSVVVKFTAPLSYENSNRRPYLSHWR